MYWRHRYRSIYITRRGKCGELVEDWGSTSAFILHCVSLLGGWVVLLRLAELTESHVRCLYRRQTAAGDVVDNIVSVQRHAVSAVAPRRRLMVRTHCHCSDHLCWVIGRRGVSLGTASVTTPLICTCLTYSSTSRKKHCFCYKVRTQFYVLCFFPDHFLLLSHARSLLNDASVRSD